MSQNGTKKARPRTKRLFATVENADEEGNLWAQANAVDDAGEEVANVGEDNLDERSWQIEDLEGNRDNRNEEAEAEDVQESKDVLDDSLYVVEVEDLTVKDVLSDEGVDDVLKVFTDSVCSVAADDELGEVGKALVGGLVAFVAGPVGGSFADAELVDDRGQLNTDVGLDIKAGLFVLDKVRRCGSSSLI